MPVRRLLILGLVMLGVAGVAWAAAVLAPPSSDPFYRSPKPLVHVRPGTVLRTRTVSVEMAGSPVALSGTQVLYRTTNQLGRPDATVATIIHAAVPAGPVKLLSYQTFYDGVSSRCRPSYTLRGGTAPSSTGSLDEAIMLPYLAQGFTLVTSDYEGSTDDYGAGRQSGMATLDAIRAAEHVLGLGAGAPVGLVGYSGGSIASEWAAEEQPRYAPRLNLVGVAAGGVPVDFNHNLVYINGSEDWAGAIPAVGLGLLRAYRIRPARVLSSKGLAIEKQVSQGCLNPGAYPGLKIQDLLKPRYRDWQRSPLLLRIFNGSIMGREAAPREPLLLGVGNADGTGDGVMIARDVQQLAYEYCHRGVDVQFHVYSGSNHDAAAPQFEAQALGFLEQRYAGQAVSSDCSTITPGNSLAPLPVPRSKAHRRRGGAPARVHRRRARVPAR